MQNELRLEIRSRRDWTLCPGFRSTKNDCHSVIGIADNSFTGGKNMPRIEATEQSTGQSSQQQTFIMPRPTLCIIYCKLILSLYQTIFVLPASVWSHIDPNGRNTRWLPHDKGGPSLSCTQCALSIMNTDLSHCARLFFVLPASVWLHWFKWEEYKMASPW